MDFSVVLAASAAVNRLVEGLIKPSIRKLPYSTEVQDGLIVFAALLAGIAVSLMGNLTLFVGVPQIPTLVGVILTGAVIGLGSDLIHIVLDFLYSWRDNITISPAAVETSKADVTTTVNVG